MSEHLHAPSSELSASSSDRAGSDVNVSAGDGSEGDANHGADTPSNRQGSASLDAQARYGDDDRLSADEKELRHIDRRLAGGIEELIDGSYESVSALLEAVFGEGGNVELDDGAPTPAGDSAGDSVDRTESAQNDAPGSSGESVEDAEPVVPRDEVSDCVDEVDLPEGTLESIDALVGGPDNETDAEPEPQGQSPHLAKASSSGDAVAAERGRVDSSEPPMTSAEPADDSLQLVPAGAGGDGLRRLRDAGSHVCRKLEAGLIVLGSPLRMLPPSLRPYVDLLALTLAFWVPLIWLTVWILRSRG